MSLHLQIDRKLRAMGLPSMWARGGGERVRKAVTTPAMQAKVAKIVRDETLEFACEHGLIDLRKKILSVMELVW